MSTPDFNSSGDIFDGRQRGCLAKRRPSPRPRIFGKLYSPCPKPRTTGQFTQPERRRHVLRGAGADVQLPGDHRGGEHEFRERRETGVGLQLLATPPKAGLGERRPIEFFGPGSKPPRGRRPAPRRSASRDPGFAGVRAGWCADRR